MGKVSGDRRPLRFGALFHILIVDLAYRLGFKQEWPERKM